MQKQIRKQMIQYGLALLLLLTLTACSSAKPAESASKSQEQSPSGEKRKDAEISKEDSSKAKADDNALKADKPDQATTADSSDRPQTEVLSAAQAKAKLLQDYADYRQRLAEYVPEEDLMPVISAENLYEVEEADRERMRLWDEMTGWGFNRMRERYPGKYQWYLMFKTKAERAQYESVTAGNTDYMRLTCFYVNLNTGKTFIDGNAVGIFALSDLENVAYEPYILDGFSDQEFLLWVLEKKGIIDRAYDYADAWTVANETDWENSVGEAIVKLGGEWDDSVDLTYTGNDVLRLPVYNRNTYQRVGIYDLDVRYRTVTDYYTGKELYRDPLANYQPKNLTEKTAAKELAQILKQLYIISGDSIKTLRPEVKEFTDDNDWMPEGYEITLWPPQEPGSVTYRINRQGTKVSRYDPEREDYEPIYGTAMWNERVAAE